MKLVRVRIERFKNIVEPQTIDIEDDVTCFIGKNEAGKTTILKALHRLNPADGTDTEFDVTTEYPRWRLAPDRRKEDLGAVQPVLAWFSLEDGELSGVEGLPSVPGTAHLLAARTYDNQLLVGFACPVADVIAHAAAEASVDQADIETLTQHGSLDDAIAASKLLSKELKDQGDAARAKTVGNFATVAPKHAVFMGASLTAEVSASLNTLLPRFFYFSNYDLLPGECDLNKLAQKVEAGGALRPSERTVVSLLARAGEKPADFLDNDYNSRKAELQAASLELSHHAFEYWKQNTDLEVVFDTDMVPVPVAGVAEPEYHRILKIELRDGRHGNVETNFSTRSSGFQWFFSFFAAFSEHQESAEPIIVLLDEPGTSLHGEAQRDFLRFVYEELGAAKQTMYTTHSQYMVDPSRYENMRAVHDRATRENPDLGVHVARVSLSADRDTLLPVESALGYSVSQHLFLGSGHHLAVEGSSDFVYLQRATEHLVSLSRVGLDPRLAVIPVGGTGNMPAFVALLGRRLKVCALIDGDKTPSKLQKVKAAAADNNVPESSIVVCSDVAQGVPSTADIEDLFEVEDYLRLYNWAFSKNVTPADLTPSAEPIVRRLTVAFGEYDHALPAHALTEHAADFWPSAQPTTLDRFEALFNLLNATLA